MKKDLGAITDIDADNLSDAFVTSEEALELMEEAAQGSVEALDKLKIAAALDVAENALQLNLGTGDAEEKLDQLKAYIQNPRRKFF